MERATRWDAISGVVEDLSQCQFTAAMCLVRLRELSAAGEGIDRPLKASLPRVNAGTFSVEWGRRCCNLGNTTSFRLFSRLLRRVDSYVAYDNLRRDVWGTQIVSDDTLRSAICLLRAKLVQAKMSRLAGAICGHRQHYGLILHAPDRPRRSHRSRT